ncbi:MAG: hypothetical protein WC003_08750 [Terrimicrobiaceae bacterium]
MKTSLIPRAAGLYRAYEHLLNRSQDALLLVWIFGPGQISLDSVAGYFLKRKIFSFPAE